jgi:WD40 repeat protein
MKVVGEGVLPSPVRSFAWSPTVDLCVFAMAKEVSAHRLTGHKVWTITCNGLHSPDLEFTHVAWREDGITFSYTDVGKTIATGLDDGSVYVWDVQDGRKIRQVMLNSSPQGPISCLNWIGEDTTSAFASSKKV